MAIAWPGQIAASTRARGPSNPDSKTEKTFALHLVPFIAISIDRACAFQSAHRVTARIDVDQIGRARLMAVAPLSGWPASHSMAS
jgi:hypothetical protein